MKIGIANDHTGIEMKEGITKYLENMGHEVINYGTDEAESTSYVIWGEKVANEVAAGNLDLGIAICGTGLGMSIAANKFKGIRCTVCYSEEVARYAKKHNDSNILALGAEVNTVAQVIEIIRVWLATEFEGERHKRRIEMIKEFEKDNLK